MKVKINEADMSAFAIGVYAASAASMLTKPCWPMMILNVISGGYLGVRTYLNDVRFGRGSTKSDFASLNYDPTIDSVTYVDENYHLGHDGCDGNAYDSFAEAEAERRLYEQKVFTNGVLTAHDWTDKLITAIDDFRGWTIDDIDRASIMYDGKHYWVHLPNWHSIPEKLGYLIQNGSDAPYKIVDCRYVDAYERIRQRCDEIYHLVRLASNPKLTEMCEWADAINATLNKSDNYCLNRAEIVSLGGANNQYGMKMDNIGAFSLFTLDDSVILKNPDTGMWEFWLPIELPLSPASKSPLTMEDDSNKLKEES